MVDGSVRCIVFGCVDQKEGVGVAAGRLLSWSAYPFAFTCAGHDRWIDLWPLYLQLT